MKVTRQKTKAYTGSPSTIIASPPILATSCRESTVFQPSMPIIFHVYMHVHLYIYNSIISYTAVTCFAFTVSLCHLLRHHLKQPHLQSHQKTRYVS